MFKKLLISLSIIGAFLVYSFWKNGDSNEAVLLPNNRNAGSIAAQNQNPTQIPQTNIPPNGSGMMGNGRGPMMNRGQYKDGTYTGSVEDAFYGNIQVQVTISNGKISDVQFLQYPNDRSTSIMINSQAMPLLKQEAITAQSASVDIVSGATDSSQAFIQSLTNALSQAK